MPEIKKGESENIFQVTKQLKIQPVIGQPENKMASIEKQDESLVLKEMEIVPGKVPDVRGMGASDAIFILENAGLKVKITGVGKVTGQSLSPGTKFSKGSSVQLTLS